MCLRACKVSLNGEDFGFRKPKISDYPILFFQLKAIEATESPRPSLIWMHGNLTLAMKEHNQAILKASLAYLNTTLIDHMPQPFPFNMISTMMEYNVY